LAITPSLPAARAWSNAASTSGRRRRQPMRGEPRARRRPRHRGEPRAPRLVRLVDDERAVPGERVVHDELRRHLGQHRRVGRLAPEPLLQRGERQRALGVGRVHGDQLPVEHHARPGEAVERGERRDDLRVAVRDLVERARVERHARRAVGGARHVRLGADAVVLVLDGERHRQRRGDLLGRLERLREHEADRVEEGQPRVGQAPLTRQQGHLAHVAASRLAWRTRASGWPKARASASSTWPP
jgi:hypothetical protein